VDREIYQKYKRAGKIAANARELGIKHIEEGVSYLEIVEMVERKIRESGGDLAFPVNISVNEVAAHFTPAHNDAEYRFRKGDVVKLDVGAHIDGYIADTAATVEVGSDRYADLIDASREALYRVIDMIKPSVKLKDIGKVSSSIIQSKGFKPIENLSGHSLERYKLHAGLSIPNVPEETSKALKEGHVVAIEPFASTGAGRVVSRSISNIYLYLRKPAVRDIRIRLMVKKIEDRFKTLPFAERWCASFIPDTKNNLQKLVNARCIHSYPQLVDERKGIVSQWEHTVIVTEDGCEVTT